MYLKIATYSDTPLYYRWTLPSPSVGVVGIWSCLVGQSCSTLPNGHIPWGGAPLPVSCDAWMKAQMIRVMTSQGNITHVQGYYK